MKKWLLSLVIAYLILAGGFTFIFSVPEEPTVISLNDTGLQTDSFCYNHRNPKPIDSDSSINVLVWNLYKQSREGWSKELAYFSEGAHLVLLQEISLNPEFTHWYSEHNWVGHHVSAFTLSDNSVGVLNLSYNPPSKACAYIHMEPWLRVPKSALYAVYPLSNGQTLVVVNIHSVNFTVGTVEFEAQLDTLQAAVKAHQGPMIIAGDFNTWSDKRTFALGNRMKALGLTEARFKPDERFEFFNGKKLDHVFYRDLTLKMSEAPSSEASDHNPMKLSFRLIESRNPR